MEGCWRRRIELVVVVVWLLDRDAVCVYEQGCILTELLLCNTDNQNGCQTKAVGGETVRFRVKTRNIRHSKYASERRHEACDACVRLSVFQTRDLGRSHTSSEPI